MGENRENLTPEQRERIRRRRRALLWVLGVTVLLLLAIIVSQQLWLWTVIRPDTASDTLVLYALSTLNFVAFVVFLFIFVRTLKLRRERKERQLGSKVKTRLLVYFISISFLPITAMAVFSYLFLNRSLEKWFNPLPEEICNRRSNAGDARESRTTLRDNASLLVVLLNKQAPQDRQATLDQVVASGQLARIEIVGPNGTTLAQSSSSAPAGDNVVALPLNTGNTDRRTAEAGIERSLRFCQRFRARLSGAGEKAAGTIVGALNARVDDADPAVRFELGGDLPARGIATPIKALAEASNEIARGNLSHRVTTIADDELALLAESFNQMTTQLEENRSRIEAGAAELRDKTSRCANGVTTSKRCCNRYQPASSLSMRTIE